MAGLVKSPTRLALALAPGYMQSSSGQVLSGTLPSRIASARRVWRIATHPTAVLKGGNASTSAVVTIESSIRTFMSADQSGTISVDRAAPRSYEAFTLVCNPATDELLATIGEATVASASAGVLDCTAATVHGRYVTISDASGTIAAFAKDSEADRLLIRRAPCGSESSCWTVADAVDADHTVPGREPAPVDSAAADTDADGPTGLGPRIPLVVLSTPKDLPINSSTKSSAVFAIQNRASWTLQHLPGVAAIVATLNPTSAAVAAAHKAAVTTQSELHPQFPSFPTYRGLLNTAFAYRAALTFETTHGAVGGIHAAADDAVIMFTNSDMLYTPDLIETITAVIEQLPMYHRRGASAPFLMVGTRINIDLQSYHTFSDPPDNADYAYKSTPAYGVSVPLTSAPFSVESSPAAAAAAERERRTFGDALRILRNTTTRTAAYPWEVEVAGLVAGHPQFQANAEDYFIVNGALWRLLKKEFNERSYPPLSPQVAVTAAKATPAGANIDGKAPGDAPRPPTADDERVWRTVVVLNDTTLSDGSQIPPFVVGGVAFDNWFVSAVNRLASRRGDRSCHTAGDGSDEFGCIISIDASSTITAAHQNYGYVKASRGHPASVYNTNLGIQHGSWASGKVTDSNFVTQRSGAGITLVPRRLPLLWPWDAFDIV